MPNRTASPVPRIIDLTVTGGTDRLDRYLAQAGIGLSRTRAQRLIAEGMIEVNGAAVSPSHQIASGDQVRVRWPEATTSGVEPTPIPLSVVYEDDDLLVINKPPGMPAHPAPGHQRDTLVNALLARGGQLSSGTDQGRPGIVHRLDKDTSGLIVVAKHDQAHQFLAREFAERRVVKKYLALVQGHLRPPRGLIEAPIGRDPRDRQQMAVSVRGRASRTHYGVLEYLSRHTLVELTLETGRTHQIRVHLAAIGHPIEGDPQYGTAGSLLKRQFLHAATLGFHRPSDGAWVEFTAELPADLQDCLEALRREIGESAKV